MNGPSSYCFRREKVKLYSTSEQVDIQSNEAALLIMARNYRFGLPLHKCMLCSPMHAMIPTQRPSSLTSFKYAMIHFQFSPNLDPIPATDPQVQFRFPFRIHNPGVCERISSCGYENDEMRVVTFIIYITFIVVSLSPSLAYSEKRAAVAS